MILDVLDQTQYLEGMVMAVANVKIQMEFRLGGEGWSEHWYHAGSVPKEAKALADALVVERKKMLVAVGQIHHVRISGAQPGARSYRYPVTSPGGAIATSELRDVASVDNLVGVYAGAVATRKAAFRGLPDESTRFDATGAPNLSLGRIAGYLEFLRINQFQIRHLAVPASDPANVEIHEITVANGTVTFMCDSETLASAKKIRVSGCQGDKAYQFNGVWTLGTAVSPAGTGVKAKTRRLIDPAFEYVSNTGKIRVADPAGWTYATITDYDDTCTLGTHRTGRPTDSPRGRRTRRR